MWYMILSALLFTITFFIPKLSIFTIMLFLIPLYKSKNKKLFISGYLWGLMVFGAYWYWLIILFKNQGLYYIGIILWIIAIIWCSLFSGIWIYFLKKTPVISTVIFFILVTKVILIPLGKLEGIPFIHPLVVLAEYPLVLQPLYYIHDVGMLMILFGIQIFIAQQKNIIFGLYIFILFCFGIYFNLQPKYKKKFIKSAAIITPWWYNQKKGAMFEGYRLAHDICSLDKENIKIIITPESTFCFDVYEYQIFMKLWSESSESIPILLGTHINYHGFPHNAVLMLHKHEIKFIYFKQHCVSFMERTVWFEHFLKRPILSCAWIPDQEVLKVQNDLIYISGKIYQLFICSEFFLEVKKLWGYPVLFLWNDSWFSCNYMEELAYLFIKYFELKYKVNVYYVATSGKNNINA
jgi:apolipoprotein N-acyltransferase